MPKLGCFTPSRFKDALADSISPGSYTGQIGPVKVFTADGSVSLFFEADKIAQKVCPVGPQADVVRELAKHLPGVTQKDIKEALTVEKGIGESAYNAVYRVVAERRGAEPDPERTTMEMEHGIIYEQAAAERYEQETFTEVEQVLAPIVHPKYPFVAGTPDRLVGTEGLLEIKCPNNANHLQNIAYQKQLQDYYAQIQGYLWITGLKWCDFVSYSPRFKIREDQIFIHRVYPDQPFIDRLEKRILLLEEIAAGVVAKLQAA